MLDTAFLAAFLLRQHTHTHTTTLAQNLLAFAWHHGMERTKRGRGRWGRMAFGAQEDFMETAMHAPQRSEGGYIMGGNTLHYSMKGKYNLLMMPEDDQHFAVTLPVPV